MSDPQLFIDNTINTVTVGTVGSVRRRGGGLYVVADLTRDEAIGAAARLLECALRLPQVDGDE